MGSPARPRRCEFEPTGLLGGFPLVLRQLYPVLLSIAIAMAIGVYLNPGEARVWIRQASHWSAGVLGDTLRTASALADEARSATSQPGYASTTPAPYAHAAYPTTTPSQDPTWTYVADAGGPTTTLGAPASPPTAYAQSATIPAHQSNTAPEPYPNSSAYPRVLATGPSPPGASHPRSADYSSSSGALNGVNGTSPYAVTRPHPLRPNMEKEAPWSTPAASGQTGAVVPRDQQDPSTPRLGAPYPKVQWAGDWRDYRGVPEAIKPNDQSQHGYLPPPDVNSTAATVDRYLPGASSPPPANSPAVPTVSSTPSVGHANPTSSQPAQWERNTSSAPQPPSNQYQLAILPSVQPNATQPSPQPTPSGPVPSAVPPYSPRSAPPGAGSVGPYPTTPPPVNPTGQASDYSSVAAVPPRPVYPGSEPSVVQQGPSIPIGAQIESPDPVADLTLCEGAQILARVGSEVVLGSEVLPVANETLAGIEGIEKASEKELAVAREQLVKRLLPQHIELKLLYVDAKRNLPPEAIENIQEQLGKRFEEVEVTERLKKLKLSSRRELEAKLREWGTSLEHEKHAFIEKAIAQQWVFEKLRKEEEVTHEQLLDYYREHVSEYAHPTRVRWEHLEVTFKKHPNKREAWQLIAMMGNAVQQGRPFAQVAKERSEGVMASSGGQRDWLTQGSLRSTALDQTLFALPPGTLSPILEDETGFHIVRVVEREDARTTPFEEMQGEIREKIKNEHKQERLQEFIAKLREEIPVTTIFDQETATSGTDAANTARRF